MNIFKPNKSYNGINELGKHCRKLKVKKKREKKKKCKRKQKRINDKREKKTDNTR